MRTTTRSSAGVAPSNSPESNVSPCSKIKTRSISKKEKRRYLPIREPRLTYKGSREIRDMLQKQHEKVMDYINRDRSGEPKGTKWVSPHLQTTNLYNIYKLETRTQALNELGLVWSDRPPLTHHTFKKLEEEYARSEIQGTVMKTVALTIKLELPDFVNLFSVSRRVYNAFLSASPLWQTLDFCEVNNAGDRLLSALSLTRFHNVKHIYLASAEGIEDKHLKLLKTKKNVVGSLEKLEALNLDSCRNISNRGIQDVLSTCPILKSFSIRNNLRLTDFFIKSLVKNCKCLTDLNLSGCKNITDKSLLTIRNARLGLESLDIAGCERVTDAGIIAIAEGCPSLKFLSLSGIPGITNKCLETLSELCSITLTTLDVDCCSGLGICSREQLLPLFPYLEGGLP